MVDKHTSPYYLYLVSGKDRVKIGVSGVPLQRLSGLQSYSFETLSLDATVRFNTRQDAMNAEEHLHTLCQSWALGHEWFTEPARSVFYNLYPNADASEHRAYIKPELSFHTAVRQAKTVIAKLENGTYLFVSKSAADTWYKAGIGPHRIRPYWRRTADKTQVVIGEREPEHLNGTSRCNT